MISPKVFLQKLSSLGFGFFSGVPCSILKHFINECLASHEIPYFTAQGEGEAAAMALGGSLAHIPSVVICQNSALGDLLLPLTYARRVKIGLLLIVSWRGHPSEKRQWIGDITPQLLKAMEIDFEIIDPAIFPSQLERAAQVIQSGRTHVILIPPQTFLERNCSGANITSPKRQSYVFTNEGLPNFTRSEAIEWLKKEKFSSVFLAPEGNTTRELFSIQDDPSNLYLLPLGYLASIALGLAQSISEKITILDGDGSLLMRLSNLLNVAKSDASIIHIVFDNGGYSTTGSQGVSINVSQELFPLLKHMGYVSISSCAEFSCFKECYQRALEIKGPHMIIAKVINESTQIFQGIQEELDVYTDRFQKALLRRTYEPEVLGTWV